MIKNINKNIKILKMKARPATIMDIPVLTDLCNTLMAHKNECVGMAANMIGNPVAIIAFFDNEKMVCMLNPKITKKSGEYKAKEGCLSLPGIRSAIRYKKISVSWQDKSFKTFSADFTGFTAQIIQHEMDHLDGILI